MNQRQKKIMLYAVLAASGLLLLLWQFFPAKQSAAKTPSKIAVKTVRAITQPMPVTFETMGIIEAQHSAVITAQITGILKTMAFHDGQSVNAGDLLFEIQAEPFAAAVAQAKAVLRRDQAQLDFAKKDVARFAALVKKEYITRQQYEQAQTAVTIAQETVAADIALLKQAEIQYGYTQIRAPLAGKTGHVTVKPGDQISANSSQPLVTINQLNPVWISFSIPHAMLNALLTYQQQAPLTVEVFTEAATQKIAQGQLSFINNTVDAATGTVLLKAQLDNTNHLLWPGLMVKVKLILTTEPHAIVIPARAIFRDSEGTFVYRIEAGKALITPVVRREVDGLAVVTQGLNPNDEVIIVAPPKLKNGALVETHPSGDAQ